MILTGPEIKKMRDMGHITINPFKPSQVNPNSYNYRLGSDLGISIQDNEQTKDFEFIKIPKAGYVLEPNRMYLGHTLEKLGSNKFAMRLIGRSSIGRLGLFLQVSADLGHTGSSHQWTLELVASKPFRIYPYMKIGQISFWENAGEPVLYTGGYSAFDLPTMSKLIVQQGNIS